MGTQTVEPSATTASVSTHPDGATEPSETTSLLHDSTEPALAALAAPRKLHLRLTPSTLITPVAVLYTLAAFLPATTVYDAIRKIVCRYWYLTNDPDKIPANGSIPSALCSISAVDQIFTAALTIAAVTEGLASMVAYSLLSSVANKYGRKSAILIVMAVNVCADVSMLSTTMVPDVLVAFVVPLWMLCQSISIPTVFGFLLNTYVVDLVPAELRTAAISRITGWSTLGSAISLTLGGAITTHFKDIAPVYIAALSLQCATFLYVCFLIPETLQKRQGGEAVDQPADSNARTGNIAQRAFQYCRNAITAAILPLRTLQPVYNHATGKLNRRLLYCAINVFVAGLGEGYTVPALIVYFTTQYDYTPQETGYVLTTTTLTTVVVLTLIIPLLVRRLLRPLYVKVTRLSTTVDSESVSEVADEMDVHIVMGSLFIQVASLLLLTMATGRASQLAAIIMYGLSAGRSPVLRSLVVSTVPPEQHAQALAAIEICSSLGMLLSPIIMGTIMAATISSVPQAVFYLIAIASGISSIILLFVRDADRYHLIHEE